VRVDYVTWFCVVYKSVLFCNIRYFISYLLCVLLAVTVTDQRKVNLHTNADDSQLYVHCQRHDTASTVARLGQCVDDIGHWTAANRLQMNPAKTELLWAGSKHNISVLRIATLQPCSSAQIL